MTQGVAARRTQHNRITTPHAGRWYRSGHGIASGHSRDRGRRPGHHASAMVVMMMQVLGLSAGVASYTVHVAVGCHGEMHLFHGRPFSLGVLIAAATVSNFNVIEQGLEPLERSRGGRHLRARR